MTPPTTMVLGTTEASTTTTTNNKSFITCNGLRYAIPYDSLSNPIQMKDKFVDGLLTTALATMFRRNRGKQPIEESVKHWSTEIIGQRVEIRHHEKYIATIATTTTTSIQRQGGDEDEHKHGNGNGKESELSSTNWQKATTSTKVTPRMLVRFIMHVHELVIPTSPGLLNPIQILWENQDYIVIYKPGGISTTDDNNFGRGINSLLTILAQQLLSRDNKANNNGTKETNVSNNNNNNFSLKLTPAHRLDKPVSGVLLLGKTPGRASTLLKQIQLAEASLSSSTTTTTTTSKKVYIARVKRHMKSIALVVRRNKNNDSYDNHDNDNENFQQQQYYAFIRTNNGSYNDNHDDMRNKKTGIDFSSSSSSSSTNFPSETFVVQAELGWNSKQKRAYVLSQEEAKQQRSRRNASIAGSKKKKEMKLNLEKQRRRAISSSSSSSKKRKQKQQQNPSNSNTSSISTVNNSIADNIDRYPQIPPTTTEATTTTTITNATTSSSTSSNIENSGKPDIHTTQLRRISTEEPTEEDDGTILIECRPLTGTRHQIRAHLALIGWPIANDILYLKEKTYNDGINDNDDDIDVSGVGSSSSSSSEGGTQQQQQQQQLHAYVDDDVGTLGHTLGLHTRSWCTKCQWTMRMLSLSSSTTSSQPSSSSSGTTSNNTIDSDYSRPGKDEENDPATTISTTTTTLLQRSVIPVQGPIMLHSWRYVLPSVGIDVTAPLPDWAATAVHT